jgi:hypothetical protein
VERLEPPIELMTGALDAIELVAVILDEEFDSFMELVA